MPYSKIPFTIYIYESGDGLGDSLHQVQIINDKPVERPICFIYREIGTNEERYGESQMECLFLAWALEKHNYFLEGCAFEVIQDFTPVKSLLSMRKLNGNMLRCKIAIQEYTGDMPTLQKYGNIHQNAYGLGRWKLPNDIKNPAYVPEEASSQISIQGIIVTDIKSTLFGELRSSYTQEKNLNILSKFLAKDLKHNSLINSLDEIWKN
ncbi:hypothetical protein O181_001253 [Austropuccinia psidii MF-1]|uniref:Reverse transcriptase RNase H-like domain-containing protein n=1 Tax=Austropuccinia psidii MF-1 TaxID=1389203 RepID=A0A9Q3BA58_9BASI|nr:hypothetical protein [Austropuccinia psidii MF-1]